VSVSIVSLNKIITGAESSITVTEASDLPLRNVVFDVTLRLVVHFVVVSRHQQTPPLTSDYNARHRLSMTAKAAWQKRRRSRHFRRLDDSPGRDEHVLMMSMMLLPLQPDRK